MAGMSRGMGNPIHRSKTLAAAAALLIWSGLAAAQTASPASPELAAVLANASLKDQFLGALYQLKQAPAAQKEALIAEIAQRFHLSGDEVRRLAGLSQKQLVDYASAPSFEVGGGKKTARGMGANP